MDLIHYFWNTMKIISSRFRFIYRLIALKELVDNISIQFYESLKHLMHHLFLVSQNCKVNLMEPKNLAIIFGPSVVRSFNETLEIVVKDMKHQCRIVEALVSNVSIFFFCFVFDFFFELSFFIQKISIAY